MEIIFLGTGTGVPSRDRASPALAVLAQGSIFLIDAGSGTLRQLIFAGLAFNDLDFIFFTHFHPDHCAELVPYLFAARYWPGFTRKAPAKIYGPEGLFEFYHHLRGAFGRWIEPPPDRVILEELPRGENHLLQCGEVEVESGPIPHNPESLGYRLTVPGGQTLAVTGDTDYGRELVALARGVDLLVTECSFPEGQKKEGHLTPGLAGRAAREAGAKALALVHFFPETQGHDLAADVRREFQGPLLLAKDFDRLRL